MSVETTSTVARVLKPTILILIALVAISSRLFSIIRFESVIHEFDPWFNYRTTQRMGLQGCCSEQELQLDRRLTTCFFYQLRSGQEWLLRLLELVRREVVVPPWTRRWRHSLPRHHGHQCHHSQRPPLFQFPRRHPQRLRVPCSHVLGLDCLLCLLVDQGAQGLISWSPRRCFLGSRSWIHLALGGRLVR